MVRKPISGTINVGVLGLKRYRGFYIEDEQVNIVGLEIHLNGRWVDIYSDIPQHELDKIEHSIAFKRMLDGEQHIDYS